MKPFTFWMARLILEPIGAGVLYWFDVWFDTFGALDWSSRRDDVAAEFCQAILGTSKIIFKHRCPLNAMAGDDVGLGISLSLTTSIQPLTMSGQFWQFYLAWIPFMALSYPYGKWIIQNSTKLATKIFVFNRANPTVKWGSKSHQWIWLLFCPLPPPITIRPSH